MADVVVATGSPGAGRSTVAAMVADAFDESVLLAGDDFFAAVRRGHVLRGSFTDDAATRGLHRQFRESVIDPRHVIEDVVPTEEVAAVVRARLDAGGLLLE